MWHNHTTNILKMSIIHFLASPIIRKFVYPMKEELSCCIEDILSPFPNYYQYDNLPFSQSSIDKAMSDRFYCDCLYTSIR